MTTASGSIELQTGRVEAPRKYPKKRLIICCDGTWQASNHGEANIPSNIAKLSRSVAYYEETASGEFIQQIVYYQSGVGTGTDSYKGASFIGDKLAALTKTWEGGVGAGLNEHVCEAYNFIVNNFVPGDELYFFGFSRGAYTARATAGLVASVGICTNPMLDSFDEMYDAYKSRNRGQRLDDTAWGKTPDGEKWFKGATRDVVIKCVGVFDTVGSLGLPDTGKVDFSEENKKFGFHDTNLHPQIEYAFHALALDEHRRPFSPTLWSLPPATEGKRQTKKLIQCWFPGFHVNVGGGNSDSLDAKKKDLTDMESMANICFAWMVDRVREHTGLVFDKNCITDTVFRYYDAIYEVERAAGAKKHSGGFQGWGIGPAYDNYKDLELQGSLTRAPGHYPEKGITHEYIHPVVAFAKRKHPGPQYNSLSLDGFQRTKRTDPSKPGYDWIKTYEEGDTKPQNAFAAGWSYLFGKATKDDGKKVKVTIPEFVIPADNNGLETVERWLMKASTEHRDQGFAPEGTKEAKKHAEQTNPFNETREFILQLDKDNSGKV